MGNRQTYIGYLLQNLIWKILQFIYNLIVFPLNFYWQLNMAYPLIVKYSELKIKCRLTSWMHSDNLCIDKTEKVYKQSV